MADLESRHIVLDIENAQMQNKQATLTEAERRQMYEAAEHGDWNKAQEILRTFPEAAKAKLNQNGWTPLHIAVYARQTDFVRNLVEMLTKNDLAIKNNSGVTAFYYAAMHGYEEGIGIMMNKNPDLVNIRSGLRKLPVCTAALTGQRAVSFQLYSATQMEDGDRFYLVIASFERKLYDLAYIVLQEHPHLSTWVNKKHSNATIWQAFTAGSSLLYYPWHEISPQLNRDSIQGLAEIMRIAAEEEEVEFLTKVANSNPEVLTLVDENNMTMFHIAVLDRFQSIFKLINEKPSIRESVIRLTDINGNNMLHLAGYLPSSPLPKFRMIENGMRSFDGYEPLLNRLNDIPGAALQLQYELVWFEEVKMVMDPKQIYAKNKDKLTPRDVFFREHENLRKAGEEWMRNTANSCMVVATLIATVVFAAAFTVPGGNGQDNGIPIFLQLSAFKVFAVSDAITLVCSISTVLTFLSILTSRYSVEDFRMSLPTKLIFGLLFLSISVMAMMIAFVAAFFIIFKNKELKFAYPIGALASIPIILFVWQHARLFYQIIRSTYFASSAFRSTKRPSLWTRITTFTVVVWKIWKAFA